MKDMTLREIYKTFGVSRRAVQGYEKAGLVSASSKNERGHLLYDEYSQKRIQQIRSFQQMGFTIKEIQKIIDAPDEIKKPMFIKRAEELEKERKTLDAAIHMIYELIETL